MANSHDSWVKEVESNLSDLSPGERARIVAELDRQVKALPDTNHEQLTATLGSPSQVANRYLLERGLTPTKSFVAQHFKTSEKPVGSSGRKFFKWATIAILGFFALGVMALFVIPLVIFKFIAVDNFEKDFTIHFNGKPTQMRRLEGKFSATQLSNFTLSVSNGQADVSADLNATEVTYDCEIDSDNPIDTEQVAKVDGGNASLTLLNVEHAECDITVPRKVPLNINVTNGQISLDQMSQYVEANVTAGEIEFGAAEDAKYDLQANVNVGMVDGLNEFNNRQKNKKGSQSYAAILSVGTGRVDVE